MHINLFDSRSKKIEATPVSKRKRIIMETSTPVAARRETVLIDLGDDSPIGESRSMSSELSALSDEVIPESKTRAGMSNELHSMVVTPPKEMSPDTMDRRLALHTIDIVKASENNPLVTELMEEREHILQLSENPFAKKDVVEVDIEQIPIVGSAAAMPSQPLQQQGGMDGLNMKATNTVEQVAGMDGMNKKEDEAGICVRPVGMDGMNKETVRGGELLQVKEGSRR